MCWAAAIWKKPAETLPHDHPTAPRAIAQGLSARCICKSWRKKKNPLAILTSNRRWVCERKHLAVLQLITVWWWWRCFPLHPPRNHSDKCDAVRFRQRSRTNRSYSLTWQKWPRAVSFLLLLAYYLLTRFMLNYLHTWKPEWQHGFGVLDAFKVIIN